MSQKDAIQAANALLKKNGFNADGTQKKPFSKKEANQRFFEKRILMNPMGNRSR